MSAAPAREDHPQRNGNAQTPHQQGNPNPYQTQPASPEPSAASMGVEELTTAECWRLVEASNLGRLALEGPDGRPDVFPLNFLVHNGNLFIRSAPGGKLRGITTHPAVAFEVDGSDVRCHWSVVIRGEAQRMSTDAEIEASGILNLVTASPTVKNNFIRLTPDTVTGRRFRKPRPGRATAAHSERDPAPEPHPESGPWNPDAHRPHPIPHHAPFPQ